MRASRGKYTRTTHAFTLLELLVVVSVIAILVAILVPTIAMVRSLAKRTECASNMRQIGMAFTAYAGDSDGLALLVYTSGVHQGTYVVNNTNDTDGPWSLLWKQGFIAVPQLMYCPATADTNSACKYNTPTNIWPHQPGDFTRSGYCNRPEKDAGTGSPPLALPLWSLYVNKAIASDLCSTKSMVVYHGHKTGVNVVYGDGSVKWTQLAAMPAVLTLPSSWSTVNNASVDLLWTQYDSNR